MKYLIIINIIILMSLSFSFGYISCNKINNQNNCISKTFIVEEPKIIEFTDSIEKIVEKVVYVDSIVTIVETSNDTVYLNYYGNKVTKREANFNSLNHSYFKLTQRYLITSNVEVLLNEENAIYVKNDLSIEQVEFKMDIVNSKHRNNNVITIGTGLAYNSNVKFNIEIGYLYITKHNTFGIDIGVNSITGKIGWRF